MTNIVYISTDGGSRGNPGEAAYGFVIKDSNKQLIVQIGKRLGIRTNNYAEYMAVVSSLRWVKENITPAPTEIHFSLDSQLIERQMKGIYKIKEETLRSLYFTVQSLITELGATVTFTHVMRAFNKEADAMVNQALDTA
jgi:ribonuclease HI